MSSNQLYWSVVKVNVTDAGRPRESELNTWWSEHASAYVARDGFHRCWRIHTVPHSGEIGHFEHEYAAVYEIDDVEVFSKALIETEPVWGPYQDRIGEWLLEWNRTYYRYLSEFRSDDDAGSYWAIVRADLEFDTPEQESEFNGWYENKHVPEICGNPGIHRAWRLEVAPHEGQLGPVGYRYWAVYEIDSPDDFARARTTRQQAGIEPWDGIWLPNLKDWSISFHELLHRDTHEAALSALSQGSG